MIELKVMEFTLIRMEHAMKDSGLGIFSMEKDRKSGQMAQYLKESIERERKMVSVNINGLMGHHTKENGLRMK